MAKIDADTPFDPDLTEAPCIGICLEVAKHDSGVHQHKRAQLLFAAHGCMRISLKDSHTVLPPGYAAWIPAGVSHRARMSNVVQYRSLYFEPVTLPSRFGSCRVIRLNPLLQALAERMAHWEWAMPPPQQEKILALFWEELAQAQEETFTVQLPRDHRLAGWLTQISEGVLIPGPLNHLVKRVGASEKTISRIFSRDTGLPYQAWRQRWRALKAIELLSTGSTLSEIACQLEFSSDSAFIAFFRQQLGTTPKRYLPSGRT
ncbi:AraC family transcriptional regulator [Ferrimonas sediminicola]|uniref:AraC family transcriptional regulator n=1 Tax=Ferrimonas sediminicola TaxID=2569538 RepID=A0A4U1BCW5_9GAMM|nr:helix-turn-helix transcriptional regulator [Ferrimonas sediminicola]TKB48547.1 AraC family transcriptional regulator [Ferrimonas sediminicola]